nr:MAG TPA: hypothetical protein [Caudoviricetes sp.]
MKSKKRAGVPTPSSMYPQIHTPISNNIILL